MLPDLDTMRNLEEALFTKAVRGSTDAVNRLLTENFVEIGRSGRVYDKAAVVRSLADEAQDDEVPVRTARDFRLTSLADDVVLLTCRRISKDQGDDREEHSLRSSVRKLDDGRWRMVFHQGTPTRPAP